MQAFLFSSTVARVLIAQQRRHAPIRRHHDGAALGGTMGIRAIQRVFAVGVCAVALLGVNASSASAGEITGNYEAGTEAFEPVKGRDLPVNGKSLCAFSGLNDGVLDPKFQSDGPDDTSKTQTPAGARRFVGIACNPTIGFPE